ncbi:MAG: hypothetical protein A2161_22000 [Candidatus Schekmanbacteria bacterium RBG_13_48_7]|uniref:2-dehydropantoate 2-reductase n=1 Tax=Candidatus Schekmanbacteria bacterium RBG_13_48_7 TaxID=1817878 RepID=A0A1F7RV61_9BACT|nr:MAG: hypothetical protein A2161_22000 [Candidatus Schekmanbacteria bacterium RBG_13_48_7]
MSNFKTAIIGAGPVGAILAAFMKKRNEYVTIVDTNREHLDAIRTQGLKVSGISELESRFDNYLYSISELSGVEHDLVIVCLKTPVMQKVMPDLKKVIKKNEKIISFQNGLYTEQFLGEVFGIENVLRVVVNYAGNIIAPGQIRMTFFNKPNHIGSMNNYSREFGEIFAKVLTEAGLDTFWAEDIRKEEWIKVILNSALSPITAITGLTMKAAMDFQDTRLLVEKSLLEGILLAKRIGYDFSPHFFEYGIEYLSKAGYHKPSMRIDIENCVDTEISFLNEKIVEYGNIYDVPTPVNTALANLVKGMELENRNRLKTQKDKQK